MADKKQKKSQKKSKKSTLDTLQKFFGIGAKVGGESPADQLHTYKPKSDTSKKAKVSNYPLNFERENFPAPVKEFLNFWLSTSYVAKEEQENRGKLWCDMDLLYFNSTLHSKAINIIADEVVQADNNMQSVGVVSKKKQKDFILKFFDDISLYTKIRPIAFNIILYGNFGLILDLTSNGIEDVILSDIFALKERLEFTPYQVQEKIEKSDKFMCTYSKQVDRIDMMIKGILDKDNHSSYFKEYLFGFQVADKILPPWRYLHFRNVGNKSAFYPFGTPMYIHALSTFQQFEAAMTLQAAKRAAQIPTDVYKVNASNKVNPTEKLMFVIEFFRELFNSGLNRTKKEGVGVGEVMVTINELFEYEQISPQIDLGNIDDIDMLREGLMDSSWLPRYMIDPRDGGFGESGEALIQKWKPFARMVFHIQNIILEQLTLMVKIHMIASNQFTPDEIDFVLTMPFPESQTSQDLISSQSDLLSLANDVVDSLSDKFMDGEPLPDELLKDIYSHFLPYDDKTMEFWQKSIEKHKRVNSPEEEPEDGDEEPTDDGEKEPKDDEESKEERLQERWAKVEEIVGRTKLKEQVKDTIFDARQSELRQGVLLGKHYYSSTNKNDSFRASQLHEFKIKKLEEENKKIEETVEWKEKSVQWEEEYKFEGKKKKQ